MALGGGLILSRFHQPPDSAPSIERGASQPVVPAAGSVLVELPRRFDWQDEPGATGYRLELFDATVELIWKTPDSLASSECNLPDEIAGRLEHGESYAWRVAIEGPVRRSSLGPFWFSIPAE